MTRSISVEISVHCDGWRPVCSGVEALAEAAACAAMARAGPKASAPLILGLILTDDAEQRRLNRDWRRVDRPTNVLAFPAWEPGAPIPSGAPLLLGDVVLAFETVAREAVEQGKPLADHLSHLVVHGVLHLFGYDHEGDAEAVEMEALETAILASVGVPDPYCGTM